ncbi:Tetrahydrocannabinolic acid synthase [Morella rubra]|uniref:Tetrahydrocannabinolic acid synthase n=1 Tax=Morella rubra TaxID=262757 RepID=A0A6A1V1N2_9ROSI|nr:Tetrahydrocannabinolic acid synthase [Morella rubra]
MIGSNNIMKTLSPVHPIWAIILLFAISSANSEPALDEFFRCLSNNSSPFYPVSEAIYTPNDASFLSVLNSYVKNLRFSTPATPKPLAIVAARHQSHVQATVICANRHGLEIRVRSGGHDYEGLSYVSSMPFIVLDMFNLSVIHIDIEAETAWVQAGATTGELYYRIAEKSRVHAFPAGVCPTLGTGGHFSGGGYGNLMRKYGLSVDNIIDAQIVSVHGTILNRESMGEDLFWAIRGGGGSSYGVILSWKIKLVPVPANVTVFNVKRTLEENATDVVYRWQHVADKLPKDLFIRAMPQVVNASEKGKKTIQISFIGHFLGQIKRLLPLMNERFPELGLQKNDCTEMSWIESTLFWAYLPTTPTDALLKRTGMATGFTKGKSDYVKEPIPKTGLESIWKVMIKNGRGWMQWNPYGGRMSEISESETPFPHRAGNIFKIQYSVSWEEVGTEASNLYLNLSRTLYKAMTPYVSKSPREAFLNYRDLDIGHAAGTDNCAIVSSAQVYGTKYFKGNLERLQRVKTRIDPSNFFRNEQSIPPLPSLP